MTEPRPRPEELKRFLELLMKDAPEGFIPWLFKCRPGRKDPVRGLSWKNPRRRLTVAQAVVDVLLDRFEGYSSPLLSSDQGGRHAFITLKVEVARRG